MDAICQLDNKSQVCQQECNQCGFNLKEVKRRKELLAKNGLTKNKKGLKRLIITREESEE